MPVTAAIANVTVPERPLADVVTVQVPKPVGSMVATDAD
jgi:hypothetical protein